MPRILIASYYFPPSSAVGGKRPARLARLLPEHGYQCDVICASAEGGIESADPSLLSLIPEGTEVRRVDTPFVFGRNPRHSPPPGAAAKAWWKARTYADWFLVAHDWGWNWGVAAAKALAAEPGLDTRYDAVLLDGPPRPAVVPILRWARERGLPILLDLRDVWEWTDESMPGLLDVRPASRRLRWELPLREEAITGAGHVVFTTPEMTRFMGAKFPGLPEEHFSTIPNAFEAVDQTPDFGNDNGEGPLRIVYTGSVAYGRLDQAKALVRGMAEFRRRGGRDVELIVAGLGAESLVETASSVGLDGKVEVLGRVSSEDVVSVQRRGDVLLLLQPPQHVGTSVAIPAKFFEYMERRRNILGLVGKSPGARIIEEHSLGVFSEQEDPESIADALARITECVAKCRFLPLPPEEYSERATVAEFAVRLDRLLGRS